MKLINYGPGEISDRLSILALKILVGGEKGRDTTHFQTEQTALLSQIRSRTLNGKWFEAYTHLAAVNALLWHAEDDLRDLRSRKSQLVTEGSTWVEQVAEVAVRIQALNDQRAGLVQQINTEAGESSKGQEKV